MDGSYSKYCYLKFNIQRCFKNNHHIWKPRYISNSDKFVFKNKSIMFFIFFLLVTHRCLSFPLKAHGICLWANQNRPTVVSFSFYFHSRFMRFHSSTSTVGRENLQTKPLPFINSLHEALNLALSKKVQNFTISTFI